MNKRPIDSLKVVFVAGPLITKGGVYRSTCELVESARADGLNWSGVILTRGALGHSSLPDGIEVTELKSQGVSGLLALRKHIKENIQVQNADVVISLIPQSDIVLSTIKRNQDQKFVSFVRGAAWPRKSESGYLRRTMWRIIERSALKSMDDVWTTTTILRDDIQWPDAAIVPAGIAGIKDFPRRNHSDKIFSAVWAARMSVDKNPFLFLEALRNEEIHGVMYGDGTLRSALEASAPVNVHCKGWVSPNEIWETADVYLGTSYREAFGRSAVEAAAQGIPVILSNVFGAAQFLYTDRDLYSQFVLDPDKPFEWKNAIRKLNGDIALRRRVSEHLRNNASNLTIENSVRSIESRLSFILNGIPDIH